ncbi:hypothetical protein [Sphingomonas xinjiangensis]|uniref:Transposase n=1 Tax=Sphingomonas xinjiangensis TaxID=643568 RepID=A0A840YS08_9SPHN|nr:hypothetical protein [Sphingomonas xinjiangensis]MBB5712453.1 hypothetical protein [Sphingomonas xinjiangensis]
MLRKTTPERALELARDSSCRDVEQIKRTLNAEGYSGVNQHLAGLSIRKQIRASIAARSAQMPAAT